MTNTTVDWEEELKLRFGKLLFLSSECEQFKVLSATRQRVILRKCLDEIFEGGLDLEAILSLNLTKYVLLFNF